MRLVVFVVVWVGLITVVREWLYARKYGPPITRAEKFYLAMVLPLILGAQLVIEHLVGIPQLPTAALALGIALNGWAIKRRIGRSVRHLPKTR